jgi:aerobic-type carbon monoxide dehydrogenase small subunit (CoxS/CutS family)
MTSMTVNGEAVRFHLDPETPLLWALRDAANLTGAKYGCDSRDCGACTVIIDERAVLSCSLSIGQLEGADIVTIEGLSSERAHPVQQAWAAEQVSQCGHRRASQGEPAPDRGGDCRLAQHLPLRRPAPDPPRHRSRRRRDGGKRSAEC